MIKFETLMYSELSLGLKKVSFFQFSLVSSISCHIEVTLKELFKRLNQTISFFFLAWVYSIPSTNVKHSAMNDVALDKKKMWVRR